MTQFEPVIGIEVHAQLKTNTKLFCRCSTQFGGEPNAHTCPRCLGMPGALPVLNQTAVEFAIKAGLALNCDIQHKSVFARKNYFYPDLPKGYQISQFELPICLNGHLDIELPDGSTKRIGITRIHMEEDAGKLVHQGAEAIAGSTHSFVDLNRAGVPLIEIVSEPDIRSAEEARIYMETLQLILRYVGVCDGNLEEGSLRADANVSLRPVGTTPFGTRTETKNINSFRSLERAINSEITRQTALILSGGKVIQQTRNYHDNTQTTTVLRDKEDSHDYRYFPDPDLLPLLVSQTQIDAVKTTLPELPNAQRKRYMEQLGLSEFEAMVLVQDIPMNHYFTAVLDQNPQIDKTELAKWLVGDINAALKEANKGFDNCPIQIAHTASLLTLLTTGKISGKMAKAFIPDMIQTQKSPDDLLAASGGGQIDNSDDLGPIIDQILTQNPDVAEKIKAGKTQSANFLMGQVMKATGGRAKPDLVIDLILKKVTG